MDKKALDAVTPITHPTKVTTTIMVISFFFIMLAPFLRLIVKLLVQPSTDPLLRFAGYALLLGRFAGLIIQLVVFGIIFFNKTMYRTAILFHFSMHSIFL